MKCKICGKIVSDGRVYKGKAICNECFDALSGKTAKGEK
jgi:hypothetical protein